MTQHPDSTPPEVLAQAWRTVRLVVPYEDGGPPADAGRRAYAFQGCGLLLVRGLIAPVGYVVTCAHVVQNIRDRFGAETVPRAVLSSGHARRLHLLEEDDYHDLAVLQLAGALPGDRDAPPVLPAPLTGQRVYALGYTEANTRDLSVSAGVIMQRARFTASQGGVVPSENAAALTAPAFIVEGLAPQSGSSGSVVVTGTGALLGYVKGSLTDGRAVVLALDRAWEVLGTPPEG